MDAPAHRPSNFLYSPMFPAGPDTTPWRKLPIEGVRTITVEGRTVLRIALDEASVKVSGGPPDDDVADLDLDVWAGVVPLTVVRHDPVAAPDLREGIPVPDHVAAGPLAPGSVRA